MSDPAGTPTFRESHPRPDEGSAAPPLPALTSTTSTTSEEARPSSSQPPSVTSPSTSTATHGTRRSALPPLAALAGLEDDAPSVQPSTPLIASPPAPKRRRPSPGESLAPSPWPQLEAGPSRHVRGRFGSLSQLANQRGSPAVGATLSQQGQLGIQRRRAHSLSTVASEPASSAEAPIISPQYGHSSSASASHRPRISVPQLTHSTSSDSPSTGHSARSNPFPFSTPTATPSTLPFQSQFERPSHARYPSYQQARGHAPAFSVAPTTDTEQAAPSFRFAMESNFMTIDTGQGPISVPIDVQGASRDADEKRRRNAGASARFRARRKEKEYASNAEIDDLRRQLNVAIEDAEFYRAERDYMRDVLYHQPHGPSHFPRPMSPRHHRTSSAPTTAPPMPLPGSETSPSFAEFGERAGSGKQSRRRLTEDSSRPFQPPTTMPSPMQRTHPPAPPFFPPEQAYQLPSLSQLQQSPQSGQQWRSYPRSEPEQESPPATTSPEQP